MSTNNPYKLVLWNWPRNRYNNYCNTNTDDSDSDDSDDYDYIRSGNSSSSSNSELALDSENEKEDDNTKCLVAFSALVRDDDDDDKNSVSSLDLERDNSLTIAVGIDDVDRDDNGDYNNGSNNNDCVDDKPAASYCGDGVVDDNDSNAAADADNDDDDDNADVLNDLVSDINKTISSWPKPQDEQQQSQPQQQQQQQQLLPISYKKRMLSSVAAAVPSKQMSVTKSATPLSQPILLKATTSSSPLPTPLSPTPSLPPSQSPVAIPKPRSRKRKFAAGTESTKRRRCTKPSPNSVLSQLNPDTPRECTICHVSDEEMGHHYGGFTCNPCKAFFSRFVSSSRASKKQYVKCIGDKVKNQCIIDRRTKRVNCRYCRVQKCFANNMKTDYLFHPQATQPVETEADSSNNYRVSGSIYQDLGLAARDLARKVLYHIMLTLPTCTIDTLPEFVTRTVPLWSGKYLGDNFILLNNIVSRYTMPEKRIITYRFVMIEVLVNGSPDKLNLFSALFATERTYLEQHIRPYLLEYRDHNKLLFVILIVLIALETEFYTDAYKLADDMLVLFNERSSCTPNVDAQRHQLLRIVEKINRYTTIICDRCKLY